MSNCLIALSNLDVVLSKEIDVSVKTLKEAIDGSLEMLEILIHQTKVKIKRSDVRMVLTRSNLEDVQGTMHVLEGLAEIATSVMVEGKISVVISSLGVVITQNSLLKNDSLSLELNSLEEVSELELNACKL